MRDALKSAFVIALFVLVAVLVRLSTQMYPGGGPEPFVEQTE